MSRMSILKAVVFFTAAVIVAGCSGSESPTVRISDKVMRDKIRGGWAGQTIGVCYGGPTEFRWEGAWIPDYVNLNYSAEQLERYYNNDDLYMDLSFLAVFDSLGLDASSEALALKFANAGFDLWHANQAGRWNILHGIMPPASGHWKNNPHADDIDFQIEADFIGLLTPALPVTAVKLCDRVGHIMNYGDGVYGGMFVAAMYSHAYVESDIVRVVEKALQSIPPASGYARCISDVIAWWRENPKDWKYCWYEVQKKWSEDTGCPESVMLPGNIDAKLNGAYIVIGLLYGEGDFGKTIEISTRCGQDSDCNPSNAGGVLGTMMGYSKIPEQWKAGFEGIEDKKFDYCDYSLNEVYEVNYRLASELVTRGGGSVQENSWVINREKPVPPDTLEVAFEGLTPVELRSLDDVLLTKTWKTTFTGRAFVVDGVLEGSSGLAECEVLVDGNQVEKITLSADFHDRRTPLFWNYDLESGQHVLEIRKIGGEGVPMLRRLLIYN